MCVWGTKGHAEQQEEEEGQEQEERRCQPTVNVPRATAHGSRRSISRHMKPAGGSVVWAPNTSTLQRPDVQDSWLGSAPLVPSPLTPSLGHSSIPIPSSSLPFPPFCPLLAWLSPFLRVSFRGTVLEA